MQTFLSVVIFISSIALILSVLLQEGKSSGMSSAIGGSAETLFGKGRARSLQALLQRVTIFSAVIFMVTIFIFGIYTGSTSIFN